MRRSGSFIARWALTVGMGAIAFAQGVPSAPAAATPPPTPSPVPTLDTLSWLAGAWASAGRMELEEQWMTPKFGTMLGMSRTISKGRMVAFEYLRIETKDGGIDYVASPGGRAPTRFRLIRASSTEAVFENLSHDFPKRIIYRLKRDGGLVARIEGDGSEKEKAMDFNFTRVKP